MTAPASPHLDPDVIAGYVDGRLGSAERTGAEAHLAACHACRHELLAVRELVASYRPATPRLRAVIPLAAAAALFLAVGLPMFAGRGERLLPGTPIRRPGAEAAVVRAMSPSAGSSLAAGAPVAFVWGAAEPGSTYRLTLVDEAGVMVWSTETGDTTALLPGHIALTSGQTYFWYVDALRSDGRSLTSGAHSFSVR